jgi:hypothetical protein
MRMLAAANDRTRARLSVAAVTTFWGGLLFGRLGRRPDCRPL